MRYRTTPLFSGLLIAAVPILGLGAGCARHDEPSATYRTSGSERGEVEIELENDRDDTMEDVIEDEIIEDANDPFE